MRGKLVWFTAELPAGRAEVQPISGSVDAGATIAGLMTTETLNTWDWRIRFPLGLVVGVIGFILRRQVTELAAVHSEGSELSALEYLLEGHSATTLAQIVSAHSVITAAGHLHF
jgi:hypothetical protein